MGSPKKFSILMKFYTKKKCKMLDISGLSKSQASKAGQKCCEAGFRELPLYGSVKLLVVCSRNIQYSLKSSTFTVCVDANSKKTPRRSGSRQDIRIPKFWGLHMNGINKTTAEKIFY